MKSLYKLCHQYEALLTRANESQTERVKRICLKILEVYTTNVFKYHGVDKAGRDYGLINTVFHQPHPAKFTRGISTHPGEGEPQRSDTAAGNYQVKLKTSNYETTRN